MNGSNHQSAIVSNDSNGRKLSSMNLVQYRFHRRIVMIVRIAGFASAMAWIEPVFCRLAPSDEGGYSFSEWVRLLDKVSKIVIYDEFGKPMSIDDTKAKVVVANLPALLDLVAVIPWHIDGLPDAL